MPASSKSSKSGGGAGNERSLTVLVLDVSPVAWGRNDYIRGMNDKKRHAEEKRSVGPATLDELLVAVQAFASALSSLERDSALLLVAVAANEAAIVYPRKDHLEDFFSNTESKLDTRRMQQDLLDGVSELVTRAASKEVEGTLGTRNLSSSLAVMASGFSLALCLINRFMVAAHAGVSALHNHHTWNRGNADDEGIILAMRGSNDSINGRKSSRSKAAWSPRILLMQNSADRPDSFNAMMNCSFGAVKQNVVVDGCFLPNGNGPTGSAFLEQACDLTGGLYMTPLGASQCCNALTEILLSVFLPPRACRDRLKLPGIDQVDFRARAFDTGNIVDTAYVCNQCLSIFENEPTERCPTCDAEIKSRKRMAVSSTTTATS